MKDYKLLVHTSDLKIQAYGKNLSELFSHMLKGMFEMCRPELMTSEKVLRRIKADATDLEALLVEFLSHALYLSDVHNEAYFEAQVIITNKGKKKQLQGHIIGKKLKRLELEIKAVTWHDLRVTKTNNHWKAIVLFDI